MSGVQTGAAAEVRMPRLSDSMEEGTILAWLHAPGDAIASGEELVEIETDKANMVYESDAAGTLLEIVAPAGATVAVGEVIARIGSVRGRQRTSPLARRLATELGVDLTTVTGTGPDGRVVRADIERAARGRPAEAEHALGAPDVPTPDLLQLTRLQQTVARRMTESKATTPHFYLQAEIDMTAVVEGRERLKTAARDGDRAPTLNDVVVRACAIALRETPRANASYRDGTIELHPRVNVGVAVAIEDALLVPTVFDADRKELREIADETRRLARSVRDGRITPAELSGATFTVSNLGMYGVTNFIPVINPPQAAILAVGALAERPAIRQGQLASAQVMTVTLAADHRVLYGADGAAFLARIRELLESGVGLAACPR